MAERDKTGAAAPAQDGDSETDRLRPDYTEDPGFRDAVDAAVLSRVEAMLPDMMARLVAALPAAEGQPIGAAAAPADGQNFIQALALQLAELTGQGTGRIYVAPEIVERRRQAWGQLRDLLIDLRAQGAMPAYKLLNKVYLSLGAKTGEVLIDPLYRDNEKIVQATEIDWPGVPNLSMAPINAAASRVFAIFCEAIGHQVTSDTPDEFLALNSHGAVVRGEAARHMLANEKSRQLGTPGDGSLDQPAAGIRRRDPAPKQSVQVLGSLTRPVEVV